ncbi:hypothetical protein [Bacteroides gallinarum]|uniref:hypothetical protein n=1 Tax=Bacteroides gallinarum TaxID=376806 RepID=UPI00035D309D|nr:hypothetical protein [Bacteroides gallinarum]
MNVSGKEKNISEKQLTEQEMQFCELYVNGGLEFAGRAGKCYEEAFKGKSVKNPGSSANYLMGKPHVAAHIKALLSSERFEMETMAVKLQVTETLKAVMDETATSDYTDRFGVPLSPAPLRAVSVNAAKALMEIFPIRHKEENRLRIEGSDGNVIFNVIVPQTQERNEEEKEI